MEKTTDIAGDGVVQPKSIQVPISDGDIESRAAVGKAYVTEAARSLRATTALDDIQLVEKAINAINSLLRDIGQLDAANRVLRAENRDLQSRLNSLGDILVFAVKQIPYILFRYEIVPNRVPDLSSLVKDIQNSIKVGQQVISLLQGAAVALTAVVQTSSPRPVETGISPGVTADIQLIDKTLDAIDSLKKDIKRLRAENRKFRDESGDLKTRLHILGDVVALANKQIPCLDEAGLQAFRSVDTEEELFIDHRIRSQRLKKLLKLHLPAEIVLLRERIELLEQQFRVQGIPADPAECSSTERPPVSPTGDSPELAGDGPHERSDSLSNEATKSPDDSQANVASEQLLVFPNNSFEVVLDERFPDDASARMKLCRDMARCTFYVSGYESKLVWYDLSRKDSLAVLRFVEEQRKVMGIE